jgi:hypothetical protein
MNRRGVVHTLDTILAAAIISTVLFYASQIPLDMDAPTERPLDVWGMQALVGIDGNGTLGRLVDSESWQDLEELLRVVLPSGVPFNVTVYDEQGAVVNDCHISNGGLMGRTVVSVDYIVVVPSYDCPMYRLRLQLGG